MTKTTDERESLDPNNSDTVAGLTGRQRSRRRFTRAGLASPVILSLASRPAFGAVCTPSGFASASPNNPSGVRHIVSGCNGFSPGAWGRPDVGNGNSDGNRNQWYTAGFNPNPRDGNDPEATLFVDAFQGAGPSGVTLHDVMLAGGNGWEGTLEWHSAAALLNASLPIPGYMDPLDVIGLYTAARFNDPTYTTIGGTVIDMTDFDVAGFFDQTYG